MHLVLLLLLYHNKNRLFSQPWRAPRWGMIRQKSTFLKCSENHNAFFWKCLTWPEFELRTRSHISEPFRRTSSAPPSSHRMLLPRNHHRANGWGERERETLGSGQEAPSPAGQPRTEDHTARCDSLCSWALSTFPHGVTSCSWSASCLLGSFRRLEIGFGHHSTDT